MARGWPPGLVLVETGASLAVVAGRVVGAFADAVHLNAQPQGAASVHQKAHKHTHDRAKWPFGLFCWRQLL